MTVDPTHIPHVMDFRGAYGRLCVLSAQALERGCSPEAVRYALAGKGDNVALTRVREQRARCNSVLAQAIAALVYVGLEKREALQVCVDQAHVARETVQSEWGNGEASSWQHLSIPMVQVTR